jgi:hypothetical protein
VIGLDPDLELHVRILATKQRHHRLDYMRQRGALYQQAQRAARPRAHLQQIVQ